MVSQQQLSALVRIAQQAGEAVMQVYAQGACDIQTKSDNSPLTEADERSDAIIRAGLSLYFPDEFVLSEESSSGQLRARDSFFLVDPLDGTKEFIKRNGEFTINIAWVQYGRVVASVVFAPALDELFYAGQGLGAWKLCAGETRRIAVSSYEPADKPVRVVGSRSHGAERMTVWLHELTHQFKRDYVFSSIGSSLKFCRVAEGEADVYPRLAPTHQWDTAAGQGILEQAGGSVRCLDNTRLRYALSENTLNPEFIASAHNDIWLGLL